MKGAVPAFVVLGALVSAPAAMAGKARAPRDTIAAVQAEPDWLARPTLEKLEPRARYGFSGVRFVPVQEGTGPRPSRGAILKVHYSAYFADGRRFETSREGDGPTQTTLGKKQVVPGWDMALSEMRKGERRLLILPPEQGYGSEEVGPLPPNSTVIFDVELVDF